ncbi:hypothetical protein QAD02_003222 [Eretmocerus hayati]|uniref:Uncharacterized protein n=1 Tax=Eretmocerus hayati TaxID=131215 RepID=A0ACC2NL82_9HYME|nr:hypothetical protein QAD02_003222 [Eretmocerus hayati]
MNEYQIDSIILHHGLTILQGHYSNLLREGNPWTTVSDIKIVKDSKFVVNGTPFTVSLEKTRGIPFANGKRTVLNSYQNSNRIVTMPRENILGKSTVIAGFNYCGKRSKNTETVLQYAIHDEFN